MCFGDIIIRTRDAQTTEVKKTKHQEWLHGGPVVKTSPSNAGDVGSIPGGEAKIPHASWPKNQNISTIVKI